ncbi:MAG: hypothetical protein FJ276_34530, partial [Planctomycetes bacterium]|nr:hypothetical protein [Planctomycetota bacterium]
MLLTVNAVDDPDTEDDQPNFSVLMNTPFDTMVPISGALGRSVLANDEAPGSLRAAQISSPEKGVVENFQSNGHFQYVPEQKCVGKVSFQYRATDVWYGGSDTATVTLNVHRRPYARDDGILVTPPGVIVVGNVLANDRDPDQEDAGTGLKVDLETVDPPLGSSPLFDVEEDGSFWYEIPEGTTGLFGFTYQNTDGWFHSNRANVYIISSTQVDSPILLDPDSLAAGYGDQAVMAGFATFDDWLVCNCDCTCSLPVALSAKVAIRND